MTIKAIETRYAGCRFRSRLEARWAVFFDHAGIPWQYEPQGYVIGGGLSAELDSARATDIWLNGTDKNVTEYVKDHLLDGTRFYLPDFLLTQCGTWIEVKGSNDTVDEKFLNTAALYLPKILHKENAEPGPRLMLLGPIPRLPDTNRFGKIPDLAWGAGGYGFGRYHKNNRPWWMPADPGWSTTPLVDDTETMDECIAIAYRAARSARFEHGEAG